MIIPWIYFLKEDEQLLVEAFTQRFVVNGPKTFVSMPFYRTTRRDGITLAPNNYLRIQDCMSGELKNIYGPQIYFPTSTEEILGKFKAIPLKSNQYIKIIDKNSGAIRVEVGEKSVYLEPTEEILQNVSNGVNLNETEYLRIQDKLTGEISNVYGPKLYVPGATEEILEQLDVISLKHNEYIKILDNKTGVIRVEKGEKSVYLEPTEEILQNVTKGINIDEHRAVLIRDTKSGKLELITEKQVYIPKPTTDIVEVRNRILLEEHETVVVKDKEGNYIFKRGNSENSSFFLEPYCELLSFTWSTGIHKDIRSLAITHLDSRPKFMWYEFEVRTQDNVELILGITFFWQIEDVEKMVKTTDDVPGDVCSHARSEIIQSVSKQKLEDFLNNFNSIIRGSVIDSGDNFYQLRGVKLHSVETRSITCKDPETQRILQEIIQETTNKLNRIQKQESENEVKLKQMNGEIKTEKRRKELLEIRSELSEKEAMIDGEAHAIRVRAFFEGLGSDLSMKDKIDIFNTLRKHEALQSLSSGTAQLFFTPEDIDLRIQTQVHKSERNNPEPLRTSKNEKKIDKR